MQRPADSRAVSWSPSKAIVALLALVLSVELVLSGASYLLSGLLREGILERTLASLAFLLAVPNDIFSAWGVLLFGVVGLAATYSLARESLERASTLARRSSVAFDDSRDPDPVSVLQMRYADGEVTDEEFERKLTQLLRSGEGSESPPGERDVGEPETRDASRSHERN
ncbi:SHOCT domain-containing protein [Haloprofundus halobius]|uniref:SHOCT domain-containing protein n=1 Tax=Haloprofundus halobius TaxID=2876194 RepID=UPI001CCD82C4|nr:SHOCT domain-containing protein [Haloprofundus halobius]